MDSQWEHAGCHWRVQWNTVQCNLNEALVDFGLMICPVRRRDLLRINRVLWFAAVHFAPAIARAQHVGATVTGTVVTTDNRRVTGASIRVIDTRWQLTAVDGRFHFLL